MIQRVISLLCWTFLCSSALWAQGIQYERPRIEGFHPLDNDIHITNPFDVDNPSILKLETSLFRDSAIVDFENRQIMFMKMDNRFDLPVWRYHYNELDQYLLNRQQFAFASLWFSLGRQSYQKDKMERKGVPKLDFQLPVHYPAWARRVLGNEPPTLSIKGYQEIGFSYSKNKSTLDRSEHPGAPDFVHNNDFTIRGSVGRLINVEIKAGTEQEFEVSDPLKDLKIVYREDSLGELEDEIIQEVVAGYTNFEMPGSGLSGYSESHEGLFGIKVRSKFGPLMLTTIASHEQGKTQTDTINLTGGGQSQSVIHEKDFVRNRYFFLDSAYLRQYLDPSQKAPEVTKLNVYLRVRADIQKETGDLVSEYIWANVGDVKERFKLLRKDEHYELFEKEGYIIFSDTAGVNDQSLIAIYMETADSNIIPNKGINVVSESGRDRVLENLWVLKNDETDTADSTYHLMWRNVYRIPANAEQQDFKLSITRVEVSDSNTVTEDGTYFGQVLGVSDEKGNARKEYKEIFDFSRGYVIFPPFNDPLLGNRPFANPALGKDNTNAGIYTVPHDEEEFSRIQHKYDLSLSGSTKKTIFNIGWGTIPGTEALYMNGGRKLERDRDYIIDYDMGRVELISPLAKSASSLKIERQKEQMFVFDRKTFLGAHGTVDLPFIGRGSYIGTSVLYQNTAARDEVPRLGQEPFSRLLLAMNTKLDFEPQWMTQAVNLLPGVKSSSNSSVVFDAEIAHSRMTPSAGSEAYIDDFESSNRDYDLSIGHESWFRASPPQDILDNLPANPPAWNTYWYRTIASDRTRRTEIWKIDTTRLISDDIYINTLKWGTTPAPPNELSSHYDRPWSGIMTNIPGSLANKEDDRYLEIWVKKPSDGVLYIDMGEVSEDIPIAGREPNGVLDREDTLYTTDYNRFDDSLNTGLDKKWDKDEFYYYPNSSRTGWDSLGYGDTLLGEFANDPARDNYRQYDSEHLSNRKYTNGFQGNEYLESEDIDNDGILDKRESFFRARIPFDSLQNHGYVVKNSNAASDKWVKLWIPLNDTTHLDTIVGTPSWKKIRFVRMWWSDFENKNREVEMEIASIKFIGNEWKSSEDPENAKIEATVLNTEDDTGFYYPPPLMRRERDEGDNRLLKREQALRLRYGGLNAGEDAMVERYLTYQNLDLSSYDEIKMYVNVLENSGTDPGSWFVYRFGTDDSTYYEYRKRLSGLREGWISGISVDLKELSRLKLDSLDQNAGPSDSINIVQTLADGSQYRVVSKSDVAPTFSNVTWMAMGITRDDGASPNDTGEIWVNGLRVAGMKPMSGWAFRSSLNSTWSDLMTVNANVNYDDADFRRMSDNSLTARDSRLSGGLNAQWTLDKFLPSSWGVSIPLGASVSSSLSRPKMKPGSDISLTHLNGRPDGLGDMAADFVGNILNRDLSDTVTSSEHFEKSEVNRSWYTSYSKNADSENPLVNMTLDRISADYQFTRDTSIAAKGQMLEGSGDYVELSSRRRHSTRLSYDLSPSFDAQNKFQWKPLDKAKSKWLPSSFRDYRFSLLPSTVNFDLADIDYSKSYRYNSKTDIEQETRTLGLTHKFQFKYAPIQPLLDMDYNISIARDLNNDLNQYDPAGRSGSQYAWDFFQKYVFQMDENWRSYGVLNGESNRNQRFQLRFEPKVFDWLTHIADYSSNYRQKPQRKLNDSTAYLSGVVNTDFGFRSDLRIHSLLGVLSQKTEKIKGLSGMLSAMESALGKINFRSIGFTYSVNMDLENQYMDQSLLSGSEVWGKEFLWYQLGFLDRNLLDLITGNMDDHKAFGGMYTRWDGSPEDNKYDNRSTSQDWTFNSSFRIPGALDLSLNNVSLGWSRSYKVTPDTALIETTITWPEIGVGASSGILDRVPLLNKHMRSMNLRSNYRYSNRTEIRNTGESNYFRHSFTPLLSFTGTMKKWPVNITYSHDYSVDSSHAVQNGESGKGEHEVSHSDKLSVSHSIRSSRLPEIKVLRWTIPIRGELALGLDASRRSVNHRAEGIGDKNRYVEYMINPHMAYDFTDNVRGTLSYAGTRRDEEAPAKETTTDHNFELLVRITF